MNNLQLQLKKYQSKKKLCTIVYFDTIIENMKINNQKEFAVKIGNKIRFYRKLRNLRQSDVANQIGVSLAYYGNIEAGKRPGVSTYVLTKIALTLKVTPNELII